MRRLRKNQFGFTLLELLIVVIIVGILATIAIPQFRKATDRTREAEAKNMISALLTAELAYFQEKGTFTTTLTDLLVEAPTMRDWSAPSPTPGASIGGVTTANLDERRAADGTVVPGGVTIKVKGDGNPSASPPVAGHNHPNHNVIGEILSTGAKEITSEGGF